MSAPGVAAFVRARLDEHAETARLAIAGNGASAVQLHQQGSAAAANYPLPRWSADGMQVRQADTHGSILIVGHTWPREAAHIALNDPVHVLAWVAAVRAILAAHELRDEQGAIPGAGAHVIASHAVGLGIAIRALAAVWRTHPDYDPAWTPDTPAEPEPEPGPLIGYLWTHPRTGQRHTLAPEDVAVVRLAPETRWEAAPDHRHDFGPDRDQPCPCGYPAPPF